VAERYRAADLFTLPSSAEAFGNVFAEALASGLPIVGSATGGIPDLVEHGSNGLLVPPGDVQALAGAIRYLANDPELRSEMALRNRAKAEATLEWAQVTRRYQSIYEALQHRAPARALVAEPTASIS
jgi:glycosyltransferase involved in cell wall biosynthesis